MLLGGWDDMVRLVLFGTAAYVAAVAMLRISGSRTLSKMNAFDLVVTIAFGSTLSAILLDRSVALSTGLSALALLVLLQYAVAALAVRSAALSRMVTSRPALLAWDGQLLHKEMRVQRVTADEVDAALRQHGVGGLGQALAVVLEADGSLSVVDASRAGSRDALAVFAGRHPEPPAAPRRP